MTPLPYTLPTYRDDTPAPALPASASPCIRIAVAIDNTISAFPIFFALFFAARQAAGHEVGILTGRPAADRNQNLALLAQLGITPSFSVGKPVTDLSNGAFKALACSSLGIDMHFDDFQSDDPAMLAAFFSANPTTTC